MFANRAAKNKAQNLIASVVLRLFLVVAVLALLLVLFIPDMDLPDKKPQNITFKESTEYLPNPFMGPVAFASNKSSNFEGTIVVGGSTWAEIEEKKGEYDFSMAEEKNNYHYWINHNRQYMLGFVMDYPSVSRTVDYDDIDIPLWLYEELKKEALQKYTQLLQQAQATDNQLEIDSYSEALYKIENDWKVLADFNKNLAAYDYSVPGPGDSKSAVANIPGVGTFYRYSMDLGGGRMEYRVGFSPNYASPILIHYHHEVIQAIAHRYDNEKTFAIIMGSVGHWGEMHTTYVRGRDDVGRYPGIDISSQYEEAYALYFKNNFVSSRYPRKVARDNNFGLHNHGFGDPSQTYDWFLDWYTNGYQDYFTEEHHPAMPDFWKTAPSGAEFLYTGDYRYLSDDYFEATLQQAKDTYLTWLLELWYDLTPVAERNMQRMMGKIGYRFFISEAGYDAQAVAGASLALTTKWCNNGTAPFYYDWPIMLQLQTTDGTVVAEAVVSKSVRSLYPGTRETYKTIIEVPVSLSPGTYQLWLGIFNPKTQQAEINLAVKNVQTRAYMMNIGEIAVVNQRTKVPQRLLNLFFPRKAEKKND